LQTFWAKKILVKSLQISTLDKVIYYIGTFLQGSTKTSHHYRKWGGDQLKKIRPFFSTCVFYTYLDFYGLDDSNMAGHGSPRDRVPVVPKVTNVDLQLFVTKTFYYKY
jgi:hypothetical protein